MFNQMNRDGKQSLLSGAMPIYVVFDLLQPRLVVICFIFLLRKIPRKSEMLFRPEVIQIRLCSRNMFFLLIFITP